MAPKLSFASRIRWLMLALALPGALSAADLQIEHVTIVSPERSSPMRDALVRVHDGRIVAISTGSGAARSGKDTMVDGWLGPLPGSRLDRQSCSPRRDPRYDARAGSRASGYRQGRPRADSAQLPAVRLHDADRSDLDAARDGALEKPRHRSRHVLLRRRRADGWLLDELCAEAATLPELALHVDRARYPCTRRDRSGPAHAAGRGLKNEGRWRDLREDVL